MKLLIMSGGGHPYHESTPVLLKFLEDAGHAVEMTEDADFLLSDGVAEFDALVFNTRREQELTLPEDARTALTQYIGGGKGFVCLHISGCRPETWNEYHDVTGGGWITGESFHPPYGQFTVNVSDAGHPCAKGLSDFITNDELYMNIGWRPGNEVFLEASAKEGTHAWGGQPTFMPAGSFPLAWTRSYGNGKVFKTTLGHNGLSFMSPQFQRLTLNGVEWATT